jgi:hypothetical protein
MSALRHDPLRAMWDSLDARDCDPRGVDHDFRARCASHDGDGATLHVWEGSDGRAMVHCFRGCEVNEVVRALGLRMRDLFPPGHDQRPIRRVGRPVRFADRVLQRLSALGIEYRASPQEGFWVARCCPICRRADRWALWIHEDDRGRVPLSCAGGCEQIDVLRALAREPTG